MPRLTWRVFRTAGVAFVIALCALVLLDRQLPGWLAGRLPTAEQVVIDKTARRLTLWRDGVPYRSYRIALGRAPVGHQRAGGDGRTPEGVYLISGRDPHSYQYKALRLSDPNGPDRRQAERLGLRPGALVLIHGQPNGLGWLGWLVQRFDWTNGSVALGNHAMEAVWRAVPNGTPVAIRP